MTVVNFKAREPEMQTDPALMSDQERITAYLAGCTERVWDEMQKIRSVCGLDAALRMLGSVADEMRNQGKKL